VIAVYSPDGGAKKAPTVNEPIAFDIDEYIAGNKDMIGLWVDLPAWVQTKIDESFEVRARDNKQAAERSKGDFASLESLNEDKEEMFPPKSELTEDDLPF
jgi:hypothetical protein